MIICSLVMTLFAYNNMFVGGQVGHFELISENDTHFQQSFKHLIEHNISSTYKTGFGDVFMVARQVVAGSRYKITFVLQEKKNNNEIDETVCFIQYYEPIDKNVNDAVVERFEC